MAEPDATGGNRFSNNFNLGSRFPNQKKMSAMADINVKGLDDFASSLSKVKTNLAELQQTLKTFSSSSNSFKSEMEKITSSLKGVSTSAKDVSGAVKGITAGSGGGGSGGSILGRVSNIWSKGGGSGDKGVTDSGTLMSGGSKNTNIKSNAGASESDVNNAKSTGSNAGSALSSLIGAGANGITGILGGAINGATQGGVGGAIVGAVGGAAQTFMDVAKKGGSLGGALNAGSLNYAYDRIEGPTGNRNTTLQLSQALGPNAMAMGMSVQDLIRGLAQGAPVQGSNADIVSTILAGQSVGSYMKGTQGRNGFFESVRQMQTLTPGVSAGAMSSTLSNYIGNTKSQQAGMYYGEGAFTMIGKGGRYKTLAEWAEGIMKFMEQHRIGNQGGKFKKDELISQNFPGSNINAWFQMMGVSGEMVDYWWQYALANAGEISPVSKGAEQTNQLAANVSKNKGGGIDLANERLKNITSSTRRDYLLGNQMYNLYGAKEGADRRFNTAMQGADLSLGTMMTKTNLGNIMSMLPTPIAEFLMPLLSSLVSTPVAGLGTLANIMATGDPIGDPIGDYGPQGGTSTKHLAPDLGKKIDAMMKANPRLKMSSGYRDTVTQNRLQRNGVGRVGPASKSMHTRGWAADIGPMSEMGWLQANAGKFGLQTATHAGEPWHVQSAGTMPYGDPVSNPIGDNIFTDIFHGIGNIGSNLVDDVTKPFTDLISKLFTPSGVGKTIGSIDNAINFFIKMLLSPINSLGRISGNNTLDVNDYQKAMNQNTTPFNLKLFKGFEPSADMGLGSDKVFGDPISMASGTPTIHAKMDSPIIFKTEIHLSGGVGNSPIDAQRTASTIADHLQAEYAKRDWRKS